MSLGLVYFFEMADRVKIGWSRDPEKRLRQIQTSAPEPVYYTASFYGTRQTEAEIHERFARERLQGEWFHLSPRVSAFIRAFGGGKNRTQARQEAWARNLAETVLESLHAVKLQRPEDRGDLLAGEIYDRIGRLLFEASELATNLSDTANERAEERAQEFGEGCDIGYDLPVRPTAEEVQASVYRAVLASLAKAEEDAGREFVVQAVPLIRLVGPGTAEYLDHRAIFEDEFEWLEREATWRAAAEARREAAAAAAGDA